MTGNFDINKELLDAMRIIARQEIEKCNRDITKTARVIAVNSNKTVKIEMDGKQYNNIPNYNGTTLTVNDIVKVTYPQGQASNMYVSGGNIEDKIKDAITQSDFEFIDVHTLNNFAYGSAVRCGKLVIVCFNTNGTTSTASQGIFFTLPENYWPSENKYGNGVFASSSNTDVNLTNRPVYIDIAGNVRNQSGAAVYRGGGTIAYIK